MTRAETGLRTNCRKFIIHYTGPIFWNTLPQQLREAVSENQFKRKLIVQESYNMCLMYHYQLIMFIQHVIFNHLFFRILF